MAENGHTPGPWKLFNKNGFISIYKNNKEVIKWTGFDSSDYPEDALANAHLIAAAPDLLRALENVCLRLKAEEENNPGGTYILAAYREEFNTLLAKARGEA